MIFSDNQARRDSSTVFCPLIGELETKARAF